MVHDMSRPERRYPLPKILAFNAPPGRVGAALAGAVAVAAVVLDVILPLMSGPVPGICTMSASEMDGRQAWEAESRGTPETWADCCGGAELCDCERFWRLRVPRAGG